MNIKSVVWDLDGVLIDSEELQIEAEIETMSFFGITLTREIAQEYIGIKLEYYFRDLIKRFRKKVKVDEAVKKHYKTLEHYYKNVFPLSAHVIDVLEKFKPNFSMGIATSREKHLAELVLERFSLFKYFDAIVYGEEVKRGKPDPEPYQKVLNILGVEPKFSVAVEDSSVGLESARKAGMMVVIKRASHNLHQDFSAADEVIEDLLDLPCVLDKLEKTIFKISGYC